ncbi:MAG: PAS domain-containing protein [Sphingorhabdus sp.]
MKSKPGLLVPTLADLQTMWDALPALVFVTDAGGDNIYTNCSFQTFTGRSASQLLGTGWLQILHPDDRVRAASVWSVAVAASEPYEAEYRFLSEDGEYRWFLCRGSPTRREDNGLIWVGACFDIDDQKRAAALHSSAPIEQSPDGDRDKHALTALDCAVWDWDLTTNLVHRSEAFEQQFGWSLDAMASEADWWSARLHADDRERVFASIAEALAERDRWQCDYRFERSDGSYADVADRGYIVRDKAGKAIRLVGALAEVTSRKAIERALAAAEARFRGLAESVPALLFEADATGANSWTSEAWCKFAGLTLEQVAGKGWMSAIHPDDLPQGYPLWAKAIEKGEPFNYRWRIRRFDGVWRWHQVQAIPLIGFDGAIERWSGSSTDIHDLVEAEQRARAIFDNAAVGVARVGFDGEAFLEVNDALCRITGYTREELVGRSWVSITHPDDVDLDLIPFKRMAQGEIDNYNVEKRYIRKNGHEVWVRLTLSLVRDAGGNPDFEICIVEDIGNRRATREALAQLNAELEERVEVRTASLTQVAETLRTEIMKREATQLQLFQAQKMEALGQIVGGVAHDFNNVLTAIQSAFTLLNRHVTDEEMKFVVEQGSMAGARAVGLVRQMLAFARREKIEAKVIDPDIVLPALDGMIGQTLTPKIARTIKVESGTSPILIDPHQLEIAVLNIAINARDAMPDGGSFAITAKNISSNDDRPDGLMNGDYVRIDFTDTGCGMDQDTIARVFEPFYTTKPIGEGTGLGLAQVYAFAAAAGGTVTITSEQDVGTTLSLYLPFSQIKTDQSMSEIVAAELHGNASILLVDDDDQVRPITAMTLRDLGYTVIEADGAGAAIAMAQLHPIDLLVTDIIMPNVDGVSLARQLRGSRPDLSVLFVTGHAGGRDTVGEHVLMKPYVPDELALAVLAGLNRIEDGVARRLASPPRDLERLQTRLTTAALRQAFDAWRSALGERRLPDFDEFQVSGLNMDAMVVITPEPMGGAIPGFRVESMGAALVARLGRSFVGEHIDQEHEDTFGSMGAAYQRCGATLSPTYDWARYRFVDGQTFIERLVLPFSNDGAHITHLVAFVLITD